ncbi:MAG: type I glyceraldehyde-3-phosphate dehydrogenase, partial [Patescibacteria group bacterium]
MSGNSTINVAINGFGRIGRAVFKVLLEKSDKNIRIVAINDLTDIESLAYLLKYDSVYGEYGLKVEPAKNALVVGGKKYKVLAEKEPSALPWKRLKADIVLECTGLFRKKEDAEKHIRAGASKVVISAPAKSDDVKTVVLGVNENNIKKTDKVVSMASCTTNCLAPVTDVLKKSFGIKKAIMTTIHSYTSTQNIVDSPHPKDPRRARAAAVNMVPTSTGAAKATTKTIPALDGYFDGMAVRVPTPVGSMCDITYVMKKNVTEEKINKAFKKAAGKKGLKGILETTEEPYVSSDIIGKSASAIVDLPLTKVIDGDLVKVIAWYDNEWGYSSRMADMVEYMR